LHVLVGLLALRRDGCVWLRFGFSGFTGYHPWFSHLLHLGEESNPPIKSDHYSSIFLPSSSSKQYGEQKKLLDDILPDLPEPIAVKPLIGKMREHVKEVWKRGGRAMIGEVGIDRSFRVPFPGSRPNQCQCEQEADVPKAEATIAVSGQEELAEKNGKTEEIKRSKNLTPFRPSIEHQIGLLQLQMDLALELGINVSLHSVKAQGPTLDYLKEYKKKHGAMFIDRINVDVHSCGGWSVESWGEAEVRYTVPF
jgi:Tat protein secretion system quality control protein TatD with DNase activity